MGRFLAGLVAFWLTANLSFAQGKLAQIRDAVNTPNNPEPTTTCDNNPTSSNDDEGFDFGLTYLFTSPWVALHESLDPGLEFDGRFSRFPFANTDTGFILIDHNNGGPLREGQLPFLDRNDVSLWTSRLSAEYGTNFNGLQRTGLRLFLDTSTRVGLRTDWDFYTERLTQGRRDEMWLSDITATFRFVQNEFMQMHTGLGVRLLLDKEKDHTGWNFLYSVDVFHTKPFHVGASVELGGLSGVWLWRLRAEGGINYRNLQLVGGYDFFRVGNVNLQGPFVGLRLWY